MSVGTETVPFGGRTAWARNLAAPVRELPQHRDRRRRRDARGGGRRPGVGELPVVAHVRVGVDDGLRRSGSGAHGIAADLRTWVNEGLMTLFFLVVGTRGQAPARPRRAARAPPAGDPGVRGDRGHRRPDRDLPRVQRRPARRARLGRGDVDRHRVRAGGGRAAHARGRRPASRVFLLTLAVVDDLAALVVIATVYTDPRVGRGARDRDRSVRSAAGAPLRAVRSRAASRRHRRWRSGSRCSSRASTR